MRILFVCTGNICRSPMAAAFAGALRSDVDASSCGVHGWDGAPATAETIAVMSEAVLDVGGHRARRLTADLVESADVVYGMTMDHVAAVRRLAPDADVRLLSEEGVADPYGSSLGAYRRTRDQIRAAVAAVAPTW